MNRINFIPNLKTFYFEFIHYILNFYIYLRSIEFSVHLFQRIPNREISNLLNMLCIYNYCLWFSQIQPRCWNILKKKSIYVSICVATDTRKMSCRIKFANLKVIYHDLSSSSSPSFFYSRRLRKRKTNRSWKQT